MTSSAVPRWSPRSPIPKRTMVTLVWNADDVADVYASLFRKDTPYRYMEMPRNMLGCVFADAVTKDGKLVGVSTSRCYSYYFRADAVALRARRGRLRSRAPRSPCVWGRPGAPQKADPRDGRPAPYKKDNRRADVSRLATAVHLSP